MYECSTLNGCELFPDSKSGRLWGGGGGGVVGEGEGRWVPDIASVSHSRVEGVGRPVCP